MGEQNVRQELSPEPAIYVVDAFLDDDACSHIIELARGRLRRGKVSGDYEGFESAGRSGSTAWIRHDLDERVHALCTRLAELVDMPLAHAEALQVVHYSEHEEYRPHFDAYNLSTNKGQRATANGGQRMTTALVYLNDGFSGGATAFPKLDLSVEPEAGKVVVFDNCEAGTTGVHPQSLHAGMPVDEGEKWAANLWFRERPRNKSTPSARSVATPGTVPRNGILVANRAKKHLDAAVAQLWPDGSLPANITYWDTFREPLPDDAPLHPDLPTIRLVPSRATAKVDNKESFTNAIVRHGVEHLIPPTFLDGDAARSAARPGQVWIAKPASSSAGRGIKVLSSESLAEEDLPDRCVIQQVVEDPFLIDGRRITIRAFVLCWARRLFVFDEGRTRLCSAVWEPGSTDWDQIVGHREHAIPEYLRVASQVHPGNFSEQASLLVEDLKPVFEPIVSATSLVEYHIGAVDYTLTDDGRAFVFEFNAVPNFLQGERIDEAVNRPLLREMLRLMCAGGSDRFTEI